MKAEQTIAFLILSLLLLISIIYGGGLILFGFILFGAGGSYGASNNERSKFYGVMVVASLIVIAGSYGLGRGALCLYHEKNE
jgi:hypothetical protein